MSGHNQVIICKLTSLDRLKIEKDMLHVLMIVISLTERVIVPQLERDKLF